MSKQKVEQCIVECWKIIASNSNEYLSHVSSGLGPIKLLGAHVTTLKEITNVDILDTDTYKVDPDIRSKLEFKIKKSIEEEKFVIQQIINDLEKLQSTIEKHCDKVFGTYDSEKLNLSLSDITEGTETSFCISEKIEALDRFKRSFSDNHNCRLLSVTYLEAGGTTDRFYECWNVSTVESLLQDLQCVISN